MILKGIWLRELFKFNKFIKVREPVSYNITKYVAHIINKLTYATTNFFDYAIGDFIGTKLSKKNNLLWVLFLYKKIQHLERLL